MVKLDCFSPALAVCALLASTLALNAQTTPPVETLAPPTGEVLLTVTGAIGLTNADGQALFDIGLLQGLGTVTITTKTIWTDGPQEFEGVPVATLVNALKADGHTLRATALNDYAVDIPATDAVPGGPILAFRVNGVDLSPRDKGPIWLVYPYDASTAYQTEVIYSRSIWQLHHLEVLP